SGNSGERGSNHTGTTQTNVEHPRESGTGPDNVVVVSTARGHNPPSRSAFIRNSSTNQGSIATSLISHRPILAITEQPTEASSLNASNQFDNSDMDTQVERKRRRAEGLVETGSEAQIHQHFLSAGPGSSQDCRDS
ncbi:hypothetical protein A2U01_0050787, partial [Trifolium medium]|nr:hypothetical protein [Trifolium medium]